MRSDVRRGGGRGGRRAFTLVELAVVILIVGILLAFILAAAFGSVEQARLRATQALIQKLDIAVSERLDAILSRTLSPNGTHQWLASIAPVPVSDPALLPWGLVSNPRAEVIARIDLVKMELPDVFYIQGAAGSDYPVGFGGLPFSYDLSGAARATIVPDDYVLPLGQSVPPGFTPSSNPPNPMGPPYYTDPELDPEPPHTGVPNLGPGSNPFGGFFPGLGIYGASYYARAALNRLIGYTPNGSDAADNDGDTLIDEYDEGILDAQGNSDSEAIARIANFLQYHDHATARSEMLYALLVEGAGPLGNAFNAEDFSSAEVRDTDNDGVPEFVDGWGKPLQFYRWPIFYPSEGVQKGAGPFGSNLEQRPRFALDTTGQLVSPAWWGDLSVTTTPIPPSPKAALFTRHFLPLFDPNLPPSSGLSWDRSGFYARRSFDCKYLIISAGPDQQLGLYPEVDGSFRTFDTLLRTSIGNPALQAQLILGDPLATTYGTATTSPEWRGEGWASYVNGWPLASAQAAGVAGPPDEALDNIDNHNLMNKGGGIQ